MKIGILTFADVPNFGANLQALSTVCFLKNKGHNPILIKWEPDDFRKRFDDIKNNIQPKAHFDFFEKYLPHTKLCRNDDEICEIIEEENIEAIIVGSDAVLQCSSLWARIQFPTRNIIRINKLTSEREYPNAFWGTFYEKLKKKIPMAIMSASCQDAKYKLLSHGTKRDMYLRLSKFRFISVRDTWTEQMIRNVTKGLIVPKITPDPVFAFNYNCRNYIPSKEIILEKFGLPSSYILVSMKGILLHNIKWMDNLDYEAQKIGSSCVAFPMPTGIMFDHNFKYKINSPLSPLDWYALIKYANGYIGENMHPIVVALHNSVPCFSFDTYGALKFARCVCIEKTSKIYDIMDSFNILSNRVSASSRFWKCPSPHYVMQKIGGFSIQECRAQSTYMYSKYLKMMDSILSSFNIH